MEAEAESAPLVGRQNVGGNGLRAPRSVHFAKVGLPAHAGAAAPASAAVFELEEDESGPLVDRGTGAEQRSYAAPAAGREVMPLWVIPLLTAAVRCACHPSRLGCQVIMATALSRCGKGSLCCEHGQASDMGDRQ